MSDAAFLKGAESREAEPVLSLSDRVTALRSAGDSVSTSRSETEKMVSAGVLPALDLETQPQLAVANVMQSLKGLPEPDKIAYARELCRATFTKNTRFEAAVEKTTGKEGVAEEKLADLDLVKRHEDGRIERQDLYNTTRGAAEKADYVQRVNDTVNPAVKSFEDIRSTFQRGSLVSDRSDDSLSGPTKISGSELELALGFSEQLARELKERGFSEDFCKDAAAAFRYRSMQHHLEKDILDKEIAELKDKPNKTAEDKKDLKNMQDYKDKSEREQKDWAEKRKGISLID